MLGRRDGRGKCTKTLGRRRSKCLGRVAGDEPCENGAPQTHSNRLPLARSKPGTLGLCFPMHSPIEGLLFASPAPGLISEA